MQSKLKSALLLTFIVLFVAILGVLYWSRTPVVPDRSTVDPALVYLNNRTPPNGRLTEGYFRHNNQTLHYVAGGSGETIVFLHGFPSYWFSFVRQIEALSGRYHVIAIDGLGAGKSDAPTDPARYRLDAMSADVIALLDHLGVEKAHLVGHDWGAAFAFGLAQQHPDRFKTVTGLSAPPISVLLEALSSNNAIRQRASYVERIKRANPVVIVATGGIKRVWTGAYEPLVRNGSLTELEGALFRQATGNARRLDAHINWYRANIPAPEAIDDSDFWPSRSARLHVPAQVIWGENDAIFPADYVPMIAAISDRVVFRKIEDAGHWPHVEKAGAVTAAIADWVEQGKNR